MNHEFASITTAHQAAVRRVVAKASREAGLHKEPLPDGGEAYAYRGGAAGIHWGVDGQGDWSYGGRGIWPEGEPL